MRPARPSFVVVLAAVWSLACGAEPPTVPEAPQLSLGANGFQVLTLQLRPADGSASQIYGPLLVRVGMRYPPNPCTSTGPPVDPSADALAFCGVVRNPGGETFASGEFVIASEDPDGPLTVRFGLTHPPNPCTTLLLHGVLLVPSVAQSPGWPSIGATFFTDAGNVIGVAQSAGPPGIAPGPPQNPSPPQACMVTVAELGY